MKELSIEQKAKRYDEAIERYKAKQEYESQKVHEFIEYLFPELKESEDEKWIPKEIAKYLKEKGGFRSCWIAWLERQGEKKSIDDLTQQEAMDIAVAKCFEQGGQQANLVDFDFNANDSDLQEVTYFIPNGFHAEIIGDKVVIKQGEQKSADTDNKFIRMRENKPKDISEFLDRLTTVEQEFLWEHIAKIRELDKEEHRPVDKVEPKFHEGDWIIHNKNTELANSLMLVVDKVSDGYLCKYRDGQRSYNIEFIDKEYRLWTIQDAKDGDVLCCESGWTCIFKALNSDISFSSYCFMDDTGWFCETGSESHTLNKVFMKAYNGNIYPATKEQRDLLFQKMKEAGYMWDAEKKELKKIEHAAWSEGDEAMWAEISDLLWEGYKQSCSKFSWDDIRNWVNPKLKSLKKRVQPKQELSKEGTRLLDNCISLIEDIPGTEEEQNWLKPLRPQNKYAYNPYKKVVESIAEMCKHYDKASYSGLRDFYNNVKVKCKDAKEYDSLFPQNRWKPSDEQMAVLNEVINYAANSELQHWSSFIYTLLKSLREQLKKLREE